MTTTPQGGQPQHANTPTTQPGAPFSFLSRPDGFRVCGWCGVKVVGRADRLFCSVGCRVAAFRWRTGRGLVAVTEGVAGVAGGRDVDADDRYLADRLRELVAGQDEGRDWMLG